MDKDKPSTDPQKQDISSGEGEDVASKEILKVQIEDKRDKELEDEVNEAVEKLEPKEVVKEKPEEEEKEILESLSLKELNTLAKREFKSKEEYFKHYENLQSFSGSDEAQELRLKAKQYDELIKNAGDVEKLLEKKPEKPVTTKENTKIPEMIDEMISPMNEQLKELREKLDVAEFLKKFPEAETHLDTIKAVAFKQEKSMGEVYDGSGLQTLINDSKDLQKAKDQEKDLGVKPTGRLAPTQNRKVSDLVKQLVIAQRGGKQRDVDSIRQQLVEEKLNIKLEDQINL